jgi:tetratricopeptide (TPR) repeat protein
VEAGVTNGREIEENHGRAEPESNGDRDGFSIARAAKLCKTTTTRVRALIDSGILEATPDRHGRIRLGFGQLAQLRELRSYPIDRLARLAHGFGSASIRVESGKRGKQVVVRDGERAWEAGSGQLRFDFSDVTACGSPAEQVVELTAALDRRRSLAERWLQTAADREHDDPEAAREGYQRAIELCPDDFRGYAALGRMAHARGELETAVSLLQEASVRDPADATSQFNLGVALEDAGLASEALSHYERACGIDPSMADAHFNAARLCDKAGDRTRALWHLRVYRSLTRK